MDLWKLPRSVKNALAPPWGGARAFLYCAGRYTDRDNCFAGPLKRDLQKEEMRYAEKNSRFSHPPQKGRHRLWNLLCGLFDLLRLCLFAGMAAPHSDANSLSPSSALFHRRRGELRGQKRHCSQGTHAGRNGQQSRTPGYGGLPGSARRLSCAAPRPLSAGRSFYPVRILSAEGTAVLCTAAPLKNLKKSQKSSEIFAP